MTENNKLKQEIIQIQNRKNPTMNNFENNETNNDTNPSLNYDQPNGRRLTSNFSQLSSKRNKSESNFKNLPIHNEKEICKQDTGGNYYEQRKLMRKREKSIDDLKCEDRTHSELTII